MTKSLVYITCYLLAILLCACQDQVPQGELVTVNVFKNYPRQEYVLQDVAQIDYVALETTDDFLVVRGLRYVGEKEIIMTVKGTFYLFDRKTGKAKHHFSRQGRGDQEYTSASSVICDENEIFVFPYGGDRIQIYTHLGDFLRSLSVPPGVTEIENVNAQSLVAYNESQLKPYILLSKSDGRLLDTLPLRVPTKIDPTYSRRGGTTTYIYPMGLASYPRGALLSDISVDTLYAYTSGGKLSPLLARTPSILKQEMSDRIFLYPASDVGRFMLFYLSPLTVDVHGFGIDRCYALDRQSGKIVEPVFLHKDFLLAREMELGSVASFGKIDAVHVLPADVLCVAYEDGLLQGKLKEIASGLKEDDNPVLMFVNFNGF